MMNLAASDDDDIVSITDIVVFARGGISFVVAWECRRGQGKPTPGDRLREKSRSGS